MKKSKKGRENFAVLLFLPRIFYTKKITVFISCMLALMFLSMGCEFSTPSTTTTQVWQDNARLLNDFDSFVKSVQENLGSLKRADIPKLERQYDAYIKLLDDNNLTHNELLKKTKIRSLFMVCRIQIELGKKSNGWLDQLEGALFGKLEKKVNPIVHPLNSANYE